MVVDADGQFLTQREHPEFCLLRVHLQHKSMSVSHVNGELPTLVIPMAPTGDEWIRAKVWNSTVKALEASPEASEALSQWLGRAVRLVYMPDESQRICNPRVVQGIERVGFADGYPYLLIGQGSLDELNSRLAHPVPMDRFRPNLVVEGSLPFAEDGWSRVRIGEAVFRLVKPCARCVITTVDQTTGGKGKEPLATLASYRTQGGKVMFGQNLICEEGNVVHAGDAVEVL